MTIQFEWGIEGMTKAKQSITRDWKPSELALIEGVRIYETKNVPTPAGCLTEILRSDWALDGYDIDQIFQGVYEPSQYSGWHAHAETTDRLFVSYGMMKVSLYDSRSQSSTYGLSNLFRIGILRPMLIVVPPGVWHAVQNVCATPSILINIVDKAYDYEQPDHYRLPINADAIPVNFLDL